MVARQDPLSKEFSRQEYWSRLPFPISGNHPDPGTKAVSLVSCIGRQILYHYTTWETRGVSYKGTSFTGSEPHPDDLVCVCVCVCVVCVCMCVHAHSYAKLLQSCPTLCDPTDYSLPSSSVQEIPQARILEWVTMSSSSGSFPPSYQTYVSCIFTLAGGFFFTASTILEAPYDFI